MGVEGGPVEDEGDEREELVVPGEDAVEPGAALGEDLFLFFLELGLNVVVEVGKKKVGIIVVIDVKHRCRQSSLSLSFLSFFQSLSPKKEVTEREYTVASFRLRIILSDATISKNVGRPPAEPARATNAMATFFFFVCVCKSDSEEGFLPWISF